MQDCTIARAACIRHEPCFGRFVVSVLNTTCISIFIHRDRGAFSISFDRTERKKHEEEKKQSDISGVREYDTCRDRPDKLLSRSYIPTSLFFTLSRRRRIIAYTPRAMQREKRKEELVFALANAVCTQFPCGNVAGTCCWGIRAKIKYWRISVEKREKTSAFALSLSLSLSLSLCKSGENERARGRKEEERERKVAEEETNRVGPY